MSKRNYPTGEELQEFFEHPVWKFLSKQLENSRSVFANNAMDWNATNESRIAHSGMVRALDLYSEPSIRKICCALEGAQQQAMTGKLNKEEIMNEYGVERG